MSKEIDELVKNFVFACRDGKLDKVKSLKEKIDNLEDANLEDPSDYWDDAARRLYIPTEGCKYAAANGRLEVMDFLFEHYEILNEYEHAQDYIDSALREAVHGNVVGQFTELRDNAYFPVHNPAIKYLIDRSQDTNQALITAYFEACEINSIWSIKHLQELGLEIDQHLTNQGFDIAINQPSLAVAEHLFKSNNFSFDVATSHFNNLDIENQEALLEERPEVFLPMAIVSGHYNDDIVKAIQSLSDEKAGELFEKYSDVLFPVYIENNISLPESLGNSKQQEEHLMI